MIDPTGLTGLVQVQSSPVRTCPSAVSLVDLGNEKIIKRKNSGLTLIRTVEMETF